MKKILLLISVSIATLACTTTKVPVEEAPDHFTSNPAGKGPELEIEMLRG